MFLVKRYLLAVAIALVVATSASAFAFNLGLNYSIAKQVQSVGGGAAPTTIAWILSNAVDTVATVPSDSSGDVTSSGTSATYARVFDATSGLQIETVPASVPVSEGMRLTYDTSEGATLGSENVTGYDDVDLDGVNNIFTDNGDGTYRFQTNGTVFEQLLTPTQNTLPNSDGVYQYTLTLDSVSGDVRFNVGGNLLRASTLGVGTHTGQVTASINDVLISRDGASEAGDVTWSEFSVKLVTPTFVNTVSSVDSTPLHPLMTKTDADGNSYEVAQEIDARANAESIASEGYRRTPTADPHNYWYQQQAMTELVDDQSASTFSSGGGNTITDEVEGSTSIAYIDTASTLYTFADANGLIEDLVVGDRYELTLQAKVDSGGNVSLLTSPASDEGTLTVTSTSYVDYTLTFVATFTTSNRLTVASLGSGDKVYLKDISLKRKPSTSLVAPLRDSEGRYYEELIKEGSFDADGAEWNNVDGARWSSSGGVATSVDGASFPLQQLIPTLDAGTYKVSFDVGSIGAALNAYLGSDLLGTIATAGWANGTNTITATVDGGNTKFEIYATPSTTITNVSVIEVDANGNPTNILDGGRRESQTNLLTYSEEFDNAAWLTQTASVASSATTDPRGGTDAFTITPTPGAAAYDNRVHNDGATISNSTLHTLSVWARSDAANAKMTLALTNYGGEVFDLTDEWVRYDAQVVSGGTLGYFNIYAGENNPTTGAVVSSNTIEVFGAMLHEGMGPSERPAVEYIATTSSTVTEAANVDESVLWTYGGRYNNTGQIPFVLNEPAATNLALQSEDLSNADWIKLGVTIDTNTADTTDPYGTNLADKVTATATGNATVYKSTYFSPTLGVDYVESVYLKKGNTDYASLSFSNSLTASHVVFNLANGTIDTDASGIGDIEPIGGGWFRCSASVTATGTTNSSLLMITPSRTGAARIQGVTGDYIYAIGGQFEAGSVPTSYIPTITSTVTRAATDHQASSLLPANDFALRGRAVIKDDSTSDIIFSAAIDSNNFLELFHSGSNQMALRKKVDGSVLYTISINSAFTQDVPFNWGVIISSSGNDVLYIDENSATNADTTDLPAITTVELGNAANAATALLGGITDIQLYTGSDLETWASDTTWSTPEVNYASDYIPYAGKLIPADSFVTYDQPYEEAA